MSFAVALYSNIKYILKSKNSINNKTLGKKEKKIHENTPATQHFS